MSLGPNGNEKGTKDYLLLGRKPESSSISKKCGPHPEKGHLGCAPETHWHKKTTSEVSLTEPIFWAPYT